MRILHIAYYTFKRKFKGCIPPMILLPLVLIPILGNSLKIMYEPSKNFTVTVAVYSSNSKEFERLNDFLKRNKKFNKQIEVTRVKQRDKAIAALKNGQYDGVFDIEDKKLYVNQVDIDNTSLIQAFINSCNFSGNRIIRANGIKNINNQSSRKPLAMDYYAVTMLVMIIWYGAEYGIDNISDDKDIINRTVSLPMAREKIIIGKIIGTVALMFFVAIIIIVFSKFAYKVYWGNNYILLAIVILLFSFLTVNSGMALCLITKDRETASYIIQILVVVFTFLSGGYASTMLFSEELKKLSILSPSYAEQNILFKIIYGYGQNVNSAYIEIIILALLIFSITIFLARRHIK